MKCLFKSRWFGLLLLIAAAAHLWALDPSRSLLQYQVQNWQWEQGLPSNGTFSLAQDTDGQLLIGTERGLARFDGTHFVSVPVNPSDASANYPILSLLVARDGALWIGTKYKGLFVHKGSATRAFTTASGLADDTVQSLYQDDRGALWVGTNTGTCRIVDTRVQCLSAESRPAPRMWNHIVDDNAGGVLIASESGLLRWKEGSVVPIQCCGAKANQVWTLFRDANRNLWAGTSNGLYRLRLESNRAVLEDGVQVPGPVVSVTGDSSGSLWISSFGHGIYRVNHGHVEHSMLAGRFVRALLTDRTGNLWIAGWNEGLMRWTDASFIPYGVQEGLPTPFAVVVHQDANGAIWLATTDGGLFRFTNGEITQQGVPVPLRHEEMRAIASEPNGNVWFGTARHGLYGFDGHLLRHWAGPSSPVQKDIRALVVDSAGDLWAGFSPGGVARFHRAAIDANSEQVFLPSQRVHALLELRPGVMLAGTDRGLYQLSDGLVSLVSQGSILSLSKDSTGRIWVGPQSGGIDLLGVGAMHHFTEAEGIPAASVAAILDDQHGSLWMATDRGILRVHRDQMLDVAAGKQPFVESSLYGRLDGMRTTECRWEAQPAAWRTSNGDLWFATANGFVRRTAQTLADVPGPAAVVENIEADGRVLSNGSSLQVLPGTREINIRFGALQLSNPQQLQFRYKLEGFDREWHMQSSDGLARYAALSPGRYRFLVQARNELGPWSPQSADFLLFQKPYLYQTWWARLILVSLVLLLIWLWSHWYRGRIRGKLAAVVEERNRISREWHDSLMAGFAAIQWQLEATRDQLHQSPDQVPHLLETAREMVRHTQTEARRIIWDLRLNLDEREALSESLTHICRRLNDSTNVRIATELQGEEVSISGVLKHNLLRIAQESLHNAIRHAEPNSITVRLSYELEAVTLCIKDDGRGFLKQTRDQAEDGHFGILGMTERARKLGGRLDVRSRPGAGTEVVATFALPGNPV